MGFGANGLATYAAIRTAAELRGTGVLAVLRQGWPQATRKGIGLDRGEDDAIITNRGTHPDMIFNQQPENATITQDTC